MQFHDFNLSILIFRQAWKQSLRCGIVGYLIDRADGYASVAQAHHSVAIGRVGLE